MEALFKNPIIRNLLAIALGVVVIINPQLGPNIVIMLIGAILAIPAVLAIIALGIILLLASISEIVALIRSSSLMPIPAIMYVVPILIAAAGLFMIFKPFGTANLIMTIFGISMVLYGISDMIRYYKYRRQQ